MVDMGLNTFSNMQTFIFPPAPFVKDAAFPSGYVFGIFVKYWMAEVTCKHVWAFNFLLLVYMSVFVLAPILFITMALWYT